MLSSSFTSETPQDDEEMKCPKCFSFFSSLTKPYILPCNHNICLNCINLLIQENNTQCPICNYEFNKNDKNNFEVNFTFLNIIIKILETKIIFCNKCSKIFLWKEHCKNCEQKFFQNCDNILEEIKINCEESAKILKLMKENGDLINKYKIDIYNVIRNIIKEIHKKYITNIRSDIKNKLFKTKISFSLDFQKAKYDMINFIKLFSSYQEHFNTEEINKILKPNQSIDYTYGNINSNILNNSYSDIKINTKALMNKNKNAISPPIKNLILSEKKSQNKSNNNKIKKFLNNNNNNIKGIKNGNQMKEIISEEKEPEEDYNNNNNFTHLNGLNNSQDEGIKQTEKIKNKIYHDNNISKFQDLNNKEQEETINTDNNNKTIINNENKLIKKNPFIALSQPIYQKKKSKFDIKMILNEEDINEEENTKNKIIVGLKDVKVISLKQSPINLNNPKLNVKLIKPNAKLIGNKIFLTKNKSSKLNNNENSLKIIKLETPSLNLLRSKDFTKRDYRYNNVNKNITKKIKNNNPNNFTMSFASTTAGFNRMKSPKKKEKEINSDRNNSKMLLNSFYSIPEKNSPFANEKILKDFNKTKELTDKIKLYSDLISFLSLTINNSLEKNIALLDNIILSDYELLLSEISFKPSQLSKKNYCLSFFPNTYKIIIYDPFNNKFTTKNFFNILHPNQDDIIIKPFNSSNSIIFDDNDLIFITGGEYNYDIFLILSLNQGNIYYKAKMPAKKAFHKSILIKNKLYIIGGEDKDKKIIRECCFFDMEEKKWHFFPNLNQERKNLSLCFYNDSILYAFMGEDNKKVLDTIEFIDINNLNNNKGWIILKPVDYGFVWHSMKNALVINIDKDKILICGGEDENNNLYKDCFLFKPSSNEIFKGMDLKINAAFISEGCFYKDEIFAIDYKNKMMINTGILHLFNINNNHWNFGFIKNNK